MTRAMPILDNLRMCVNKRNSGGLRRKPTKVPFNVPLECSFKKDRVPSQLRDLLVHIACNGVAVTDLFRRPGNPKHMKIIMHDLQNGNKVAWEAYNFYTLANVAKKFLLNLEGGLLGMDAEEALIAALHATDDQSRIEAMHKVIVEQPIQVQRFMALLFGIWFRMIYHTEVNAMSVEAVAKSVAGSVFSHYCTSPERVEEASKVMEYLITGFASLDLFGPQLIDYFTSETGTSISRVEKYKYEFVFPKDVPRNVSTRFFDKILQKEAQHYGFDVIRDEVDQQAFEQASWGACSRVKMTSNNNYRPLHEEKENFNLIHNNIPHSRNSMKNSTRATSAGTGDEKPTPKLQRHASSGSKHGIELNAYSRDVDGIQQLSEKRTCVIPPTLVAAGDMSGLLDASNLTLSSRDSLTKHINAPVYHSSKRMAATPGSEPSPHHHAFGARNNNNNCNGLLLSQNPKMQISQSIGKPKSLFCGCLQVSGGGATAPGLPNSNSIMGLHSSAKDADQGSFSSVRRRQLERWQKRADWFLSPPAGSRSTELMKIGSDGSPTLEEARITALSSGLLTIAQQGRLPQSQSCYESFSKVACSTGALVSPKPALPSQDMEVRYFLVERYYGPKNGNKTAHHQNSLYLHDEP